ncbi:MAG: 16S rRNA (cytosine(1402)-N(4))-methyltransferase RsmH [Verrucomicrobiae bacterium]|nr:16S rRNA (cytosine(1402)-N(4))-methyltransferase RsmH [Verrucomicrobiae bacterium]
MSFIPLPRLFQSSLFQKMEREMSPFLWCHGRKSLSLPSHKPSPSFDCTSDRVFSLRAPFQKKAVPMAKKKETQGKMDEHKPFVHKSVLAKEVVDFLQPKPGMTILDGTLGGGGHTELFLKAGATVIGLDRDPEALAFASERLKIYGDRFIPKEGNYVDADKYLSAIGIPRVDGILLDLGVSSYQLDTAERGFSFQKEGPLDMRMGNSSTTAADIINSAPLSELLSIFRNYGDEPRAMMMATRIIRERQHQVITTTTQLSSIVAAGMPLGPRHPATRIFQALRIAVNEEISQLEEALPRLSNILEPKGLIGGGRLAIITFHSLEDRPVKRFFRKHAAVELDDPTWAAPRPNPDRIFTLPKNWSLEASPEEISKNPRARSARLRMAEHL